MDYSDIGLWIVQGLLAFAMIASGGMKAATPREKLMARMAWVAGFPTWAPVAIGAAEVAGGLGMILPWASGIFVLCGSMLGFVYYFGNNMPFLTYRNLAVNPSQNAELYVGAFTWGLIWILFPFGAA